MVFTKISINNINHIGPTIFSLAYFPPNSPLAHYGPHVFVPPLSICAGHEGVYPSGNLELLVLLQPGKRVDCLVQPLELGVRRGGVSASESTPTKCLACPPPQHARGDAISVDEMVEQLDHWCLFHPHDDSGGGAWVVLWWRTGSWGFSSYRLGLNFGNQSEIPKSTNFY